MFTSNIYQATASGHFVNEAHRRIAEIIADYDPNLRLAYIPESDRDTTNPDEKPFAVIDLGGGIRPQHVVFFADECDEKLLARLFENDLTRVDVRARLDAMETAKKVVALKQEMERQEWAADIAKTLETRRSFS